MSVTGGGLVPPEAVVVAQPGRISVAPISIAASAVRFIDDIECLSQCARGGLGFPGIDQLAPFKRATDHVEEAKRGPDNRNPSHFTTGG